MSDTSTSTIVATMAVQSRSLALGGFVACVDANEFVRLLGEYEGKRSPLVHAVVGVLSKKNVYAFSVQGLIIVYCGSDKLPVTPDIQARDIVFPESWRCCR